MNDRFKDLARQAYQYACETSKIPPNVCLVGSDYFLALELEKFGLLVVADCLRVHGCVTTDHFTTDGALEEVERITKKRFSITD
jgi:hypothetical protein